MLQKQLLPGCRISLIVFHFHVYFEKSDIIMTIAARANMKMNMNEYSSIVDTHIKSNIVAAIKNMVSVRFIKSPA